ncbi:MAG: hypothetical protein MHM6MM_004103 [Cercozoa sp. M6MM]
MADWERCLSLLPPLTDLDADVDDAVVPPPSDEGADSGDSAQLIPCARYVAAALSLNSAPVSHCEDGTAIYGIKSEIPLDFFAYPGHIQRKRRVSQGKRSPVEPTHKKRRRPSQQIQTRTKEPQKRYDFAAAAAHAIRETSWRAVHAASDNTRRTRSSTKQARSLASQSATLTLSTVETDSSAGAHETPNDRALQMQALERRYAALLAQIVAKDGSEMNC